MPAFTYLYQWLFKNNYNNLKKWLSLSLSPTKTAMALTFGFYFGLFPLTGSTTLLCFLIAIIFRLNHWIVQAVNLLLSPVQLLLLYPFMKAGRMLFFTQKDVMLDFSAGQLLEISRWHKMLSLLESMAGGIAIWAILSLSTGYWLYKYLFRYLTIRGAEKYSCAG